MRSTAASGVPSRRFIASPSIRALPRNSRRRPPETASTNTTLSFVVSAPLARSKRGLVGR